jgi:UPF0716 protein FxsA
MSLGVLFAILIPIAEVWTAIQVAHHIGWPLTIALVIVISACGPSLVRRQGIGVWRRAQLRLQAGEVPGREAIDGVLLLVAGGLLTFPGFITGGLGLLLLLPPVRRLVRLVSGTWLARKLRKSAVSVETSVGGLRPGTGDGGSFDPGGRVMTTRSYRVEHPRGTLGAPTEPEHPTSGG